MQYVSVKDMKKYLYIDFDDDDSVIGDMINAAEEIIAKRLDVPDLSVYEDKTDKLPNPLIACIKIMVANMYNSRESVAFNAVPQRIPYSLEYLLQPYKIYDRETKKVVKTGQSLDGGLDMGTFDDNGNTLDDETTNTIKTDDDGDDGFGTF